jgi:hypothetical protein
MVRDVKFGFRYEIDYPIFLGIHHFVTVTDSGGFGPV